MRRTLFRLCRLECRTVPNTYTVTNTADSGPGSLRQAALDANVTYECCGERGAPAEHRFTAQRVAGADQRRRVRQPIGNLIPQKTDGVGLAGLDCQHAIENVAGAAQYDGTNRQQPCAANQCVVCQMCRACEQSA